MSQSENYVPGPPRKFLKKGEGLKRFAAYRPPLPLSANRVQRRQTFVKFKLDNKLNRKNESQFPPPDLLLDDSINLSTEVPRMAPPKIMRTPIRPALGSLKPSVFNRQQTNGPEPKRYNLRSRRQMKATVERHIEPLTFSDEEEKIDSNSDINSNIDHLMKKIEHKKNLLENKTSDSEETQEDDGDNHEHDIEDEELIQENLSTRSSNQQSRRHQAFDLSIPTPGTILLAFGKHLQEIQNTVNELKNKIDSIDLSTTKTKAPQPSKSSRKTSRSRQATCSTIKTNRPSANADNLTPRKIENLRDRVAHLGAWFEEMNI